MYCQVCGRQVMPPLRLVLRCTNEQISKPFQTLRTSEVKIALSHSAVTRRAVNRETQGSGLPKTQSLISYIAYTSWRLNKNVQNSGKTGKEHVSPSQLFSSLGLQIQPTYFEDTA